MIQYFCKLFSKTIIHIDFIHSRFELSFYQHDKPVSYTDAMSNPAIAKTFSGGLPGLKEHQALLPVSSMRDYYLCPNDFGKGKMKLVFSEAAAALQFAKVNEGKLFQYSYDPETGSLQKIMKAGLLPLEPGYYLENNTIWYEMNEAFLHIVETPYAKGQAAIDIIQGKYPGLESDVKMAGQGIFRITGGFTACQQFEICCEARESGEKQYLKDAPEYCIIDNLLFKEFPEVKECFQEQQRIVLLREQIPAFVDSNRKWLFELASFGLTSILEKEIFVTAGELALVLLCWPEESSCAAGRAFAVPKLICRHQYYDAASISAQMEQEYIYLSDRWVRRADIASVGIGPLGRLIDGTRIGSLELKPAEVLTQGSKRLEGLWSQFVFKEHIWYPSGSRQELYRCHLEFLRRYGLSGGAAVGDLASEPELFAYYVRYLSETVTAGSVLVLVKKTYYDECVRAGGFGNAVIRLKKNAGEEFAEGFDGVVVAFYNHLDKDTPLTQRSWSLLLLTEPEIMFKTTRSKLYGIVNGIPAKVRLGSFITELDRMTPQQKTVMLKLFHLPLEYGPLLANYYVRYIGIELELPQPYPLYKKPDIQMKQPFRITPDKAGDIACANAADSANYQSRMLQSGHLNFLKDAQKYKNAIGVQSEPVTYDKVVQPQYRYMNDQQLQWYFYWRSEVRKGNRMHPFGGSYVLLYAFEIINGVGIVNETDGYYKLKFLWETFPHDHPWIKKALTRWLIDYQLVHGLTEYLPKILSKQLDDEDEMTRNLRIYHQYIQAMKPVSWEDMKWLSGYRIADSRFYQAGNEGLLSVHAVAVFKRLDEYLVNKYSLTVFQMFGPIRMIRYRHDCFTNAIYPGYAYRVFELFDYYGHAPLRDFISSVLKYVENKLRIKSGFNGRLKITLDPDLQELVNVYFRDAAEVEVPVNAASPDMPKMS